MGEGGITEGGFSGHPQLGDMFTILMRKAEIEKKTQSLKT